MFWSVQCTLLIILISSNLPNLCHHAFPPPRTRHKQSQNRQGKKHSHMKENQLTLLEGASIKRNTSVNFFCRFFLHLLNPQWGHHPPLGTMPPHHHLQPPPCSNFLTHHSPMTLWVTLTIRTESKMTTTPTPSTKTSESFAVLSSW